MRIIKVIVFGIVMATSSAVATAADWRPSQAVRVVVPFAAGGVTDSVARIIGASLQTALGKPVMIENRAGAGGGIAAEIVARADPDGHTLFLATVGTNSIAPGLKKDLTYDPSRDFAPIALATSTPMLLVVNSTKPISSLSQLIELGRQRSLTFGSSGVGSAVHLANEWFVAMAGMKAVHVAYRGSSQSITDLLAGRIDFIIDPVSSTMPYVASGQLRLLAISTKDTMGLAGLDGVPPLADRLPGYEAIVWNGFVAPAKTPPEVIDVYSTAIRDALADPGVRKKLQDIGAAPTYLSSSEFGAYIAAETVKYGAIIKAAGLEMP